MTPLEKVNDFLTQAGTFYLTTVDRDRPKCRPVDLGVRASFADLGATAAHYLGVAMPPVGQSFLDCIFTE